jgi:pseudaminic acid biosynthesis-associated methylase
MTTEQESFWKGEFGTEYTERNNNELIKNNTNLFKKILQNIEITSLFEIGCNRGLNLISINNINNNISLNGLEINKYAYELLSELNICNNLYNNSIFDFNEKEKYDLVFTKGVLIHINPNKLNDIYQKMYELSNKYILIAEYYSKDIREIIYRGNSDKLFKRDFCGELMTKYKDLKLIDYGFVYHKDPSFPLDDISWFLLKKK